MALLALRNQGGQTGAQHRSLSSLVSYKQKPQRFSFEAYYVAAAKSKGTEQHSVGAYVIITSFAGLPRDGGDFVETVDGPDRVRIFEWVNEKKIRVNVFEMKESGAAKTDPRKIRRFHPEHPLYLSVGEYLRVGVSLKGGGVPTSIGVPVVMGNVYAQITYPTAAHDAGLFISADDLVESTARPVPKGDRNLYADELLCSLFPYERQHFPVLSSSTFTSEVNAQPLDDLKITVSHEYRQPPSTLCFINSWLHKDEHVENYWAQRFVLPDPSWRFQPGVTAKAGLAIGVSSQTVSLKYTLPTPAASALAPTLDMVVSFAARDFISSFEDKPVITGVNRLQIYEGAQLHTGLPYPPLAAAILMPHKSVRPPVPYYILFETNFSKSTTDMLNQPTGAGQLKATGLDQVLLGNVVVVRPALPAYIKRYGIPVAIGDVRKRFVELRIGSYDQRDLALPHLNDQFTYENYKRKIYMDGKCPLRTEDQLNEPTFDRHPGGFILLDGYPERMDQYLRDSNTEYDFYALCIARELPESLALPMESEPAFVEQVGEDLAPLRCSIKSTDKGREYIHSVLNHFRAKSSVLNKKYTSLTEDALLDAAIYMQEPFAHPGQDEKKGKLKKTCEPIFVYFALPKNYEPLDPSDFVQPSSLSLKRPREEEEEKSAIPPPPQLNLAEGDEIPEGIDEEQPSSPIS